ncbi:polymerase delta-interacting 2 [Olea europaea subsp. europaea]|uniref:Polymerase delta-interacting 2 n=1 Tax=Olea europaea subsp. europaea TaxID=158383 RepID=A0A8S0Q6F5_OLEEU|nr:polymerase delta-interacting 2 [Olea europaea subsp. europaea]
MALKPLNYCIRLTNKCHSQTTRRYSSTKLAEVGRFEHVLADENCYPAGQPFLHRIFGYRGVVLFPWLARVHDFDMRKQYTQTPSTLKLEELPHKRKSSRRTNDGDKAEEDSKSKARSTSGEDEHEGDAHSDANEDDESGNPTIELNETQRFTNPQSTRFHPYYQVLIDTRDCVHVSSRTSTEAVTHLGHPDNSKSVFSIKGLDYVAHEDILPYKSLEEPPIEHELHKKLFKSNAESQSYEPTDLLDSWRSKHPWLELSRIYRETTQDIRVTVIPFYLGHNYCDGSSFHWWRYCIRLENFSDMTIQLRERHWRIFSRTKQLQTIKGRGVMGIEPSLTPTEPAYQYSSHVNLEDKSGLMWGTFKMQREDGHTFECKVPPFSLESSLTPIPNAPNTPI